MMCLLTQTNLKGDLTNNIKIYKLIDDRVTEAENPLNVEFLTKQQ